MARRKRENVDVSLFPFLSVLCSVIGVLLLFIVLVLSTRVIAVEEERYAETEEYKRAPAPGRPNVLEEGIDDRNFNELQAEVNRLEELLKERQEQREALSRKLASLEDLIEFKKTEFLIPVKVTRPQEFDKPVPVAIVPDAGYKVNLRPIFVEVTSQGYTIQPSKRVYPLIAEAAAQSQLQPTVDPELGKHLRTLNHRKEYLVFLVHPNGVAAFYNLVSYVRSKHVDLRVGWEPFARNWLFANEAEK